MGFSFFGELGWGPILKYQPLVGIYFEESFEGCLGAFWCSESGFKDLAFRGFWALKCDVQGFKTSFETGDSTSCCLVVAKLIARGEG